MLLTGKVSSKEAETTCFGGIPHTLHTRKERLDKRLDKSQQRKEPKLLKRNRKCAKNRQVYNFIFKARNKN